MKSFSKILEVGKWKLDLVKNDNVIVWYRGVDGEDK